MRSFASVLCVMSAVLFACGDNRSPAGADDDMSAGTHDSDQGPGSPRAITAALDVGSPSCDAATASFEVLARHVDDSTSVANRKCHITFDDGATSDLCLGEHIFASAGAHTFTVDVTDLDTRATAHAEVKRVIATPLTVELSVDVPACGLEVSFSAALSTGAEVHATMEPADKVVVPTLFGRTGKFEAREPGTFTIMLSVEDERPTGPICDREVTKTVTLNACPCP